MYDPEMRKDCPMRGTLGNCSSVGGFCVDAVSDEICEAVHNAYQQGYMHAIIRLKEQEAVEDYLRAAGGEIEGRRVETHETLHPAEIEAAVVGLETGFEVELVAYKPAAMVEAHHPVAVWGD